MYKRKYEKYKAKYLQLKQRGGNAGFRISGPHSFYIITIPQYTDTYQDQNIVIEPKILYLFGDSHFSFANMCDMTGFTNRPLSYQTMIDNCNKQPDCIFIANLFDRIIEANNKRDAPDHMNIFLEVGQQDLNKPPSGVLNYVARHYYGCMFDKICPENITVERIDFRSDLPLQSAYIDLERTIKPKLDLIRQTYDKYSTLSPGKVKYYDNMVKDILLWHIKNRPQMELYLNKTSLRAVFDDLLNDITIAQLNKCPDKMREAIYKYPDVPIKKLSSQYLELAKLYAQIKKVDYSKLYIEYQLPSRDDLALLSTFYKQLSEFLLDFHVVVMDIYVLGRIFEIGNNRTILYTGEDHTKAYLDFLNSLQTPKIVYQYNDPEEFEGEDIRCVMVKLPMSQILNFEVS